MRQIKSGKRHDLFTPTVRRSTTVDLVLNKIKTLVLSKELKPGDRLPNEMELAGSLSVSRGTVREAMKMLSALGIVEIIRGDGTYITNTMSPMAFDPLLFSLALSKADLQKMIELREFIELGLVQFIIKNAREEDFVQLEVAMRDMEEKEKAGERDPVVLGELDMRFHLALGAATQNELIQKIYNTVLEFFAPSIAKTHVFDENRTMTLNLHREILESLRARDLDRAHASIEASVIKWMTLVKGKDDGLAGN